MTQKFPGLSRGPWNLKWETVDQWEGGSGLFIVDANGNYICEVCEVIDGTNDENNAKVLAASYEMLDALMDARDELADAGWEYGEHHVYTKVVNAIGKALMGHVDG